MLPDCFLPGYTYYNQPSTVAVLIDPEGGYHQCSELSDGMFWAAGMVAKSPAILADRIHADWFKETPDPDTKYARQERCFGEQP